MASKHGPIAILLPDLRCGGAERVVVNLANAFVARDLEVDMVLMSADGPFVAPLDSRVRVVDLRVSRMRHLLWPLRRYMRTSQPSALLACMWPVTVIALLANKLAATSARVVIAEHTNWSINEISHQPLRRWILRRTMRALFPSATHVVTVSKGAGDYLAKISNLPREAITTIYNPIAGGQEAATDSHMPCSHRWCVGSHKRVLAVGRLIAVKDYPTLLNAFARVRLQVDARLLILGDGECKENLKALANRLGIDEVVEMPGSVNNVAYYYRRADLHVLSSRGEGFGNVIVEALEAGTPVVSTDCQSGPREILADGRFGRLVAVGDVEALAAAIVETLGETPDRQALRARAKEFGIERGADQYLALLLPKAHGGGTR